MSWSHSRIAAFEACPRRYQYDYVEKRPKSFETVEAFMGSRVHDTVEGLFATRHEAGADPTLADALAAYRFGWDWERAALRVPLRIVKPDETEAGYFDIGTKIIERFYPRFVADRLETVGIEVEVSCTIPTSDPEAPILYRGFIDRVAADPNLSDNSALTIIDYKTTKWVPRKFEGKEADQLRAYGLCLMRANPTLKLLRLVADFVRTGDQRVGLMHREDMDAVEARIARRVSSASAAREFPPVVGRLCDWCAHNDVCPARNAGEGLPF